MAEDEELTTAKVIEYLNEKKVDKPCAACGCDTWVVPQFDPGLEGALLLIEEGSPQIGGRHIPVINVFCKNCGLIRNFPARTIRRWASGKEATDG